MLDPIAIAVTPDDYIFVLDAGRQCIKKFDDEGQLIAQWGSPGTGNGQFQLASDLDLNSLGEVFVADRGNDRVQFFDLEGTFLREWGDSGTENGKLTDLRSLSHDGEDVIVTLEGFEGRIQKFSMTGEFLGLCNPHLAPDSPFSRTQTSTYQRISVDPIFGFIHITHLNPGASAVIRLDESGGIMGVLSAPELGDPAYDSAYGTFVDPLGNIYITDIALHRVVKFAQSGSYLTHWGGLGSTIGTFDEPYDVGANGNGFVFVVDRRNQRVQKFADASLVKVEHRPKTLSTPQLHPGTPNPAFTVVHLDIDLPSSSRIDLSIVDLRGRIVRQLIEDQMIAEGLSRWHWNLQDETGRRVPPGVYFARLQVRSEVVTSKIVVE